MQLSAAHSHRLQEHSPGKPASLTSLPSLAFPCRSYEPVVWLERPVPLYERIALYSIAGGPHSCRSCGLMRWQLLGLHCRLGAVLSALAC